MKRFFLFGTPVKGRIDSLALLLMRVLAGGLMMLHGIEKLQNFEALAPHFLDPIGLGSKLTLLGAISTELFISLLVVIGLFTRLALLPLIGLMSVAFFIVHANDPFAVKELALLYLGIYVILFIFGPGKYSIDRALLAKRF